MSSQINKPSNRATNLFKNMEIMWILLSILTTQMEKFPRKSFGK